MLNHMQLTKRTAHLGFQLALVVKNTPTNAGDLRDDRFSYGPYALGRSPGGGHGNPLQYSSLENPMDRGALQATIHGITESWTQLKRVSTHARTLHICFCLFAFAVFSAYNITILSLSPIICKENCLPIGVLWENITGNLLDPIGRAARLKERSPPPWGQNLCLFLTLYALSLGVWPRALHLVNSQQVLLSQWLCEAPLTKTFTREVLKLFLLIWIKIPERWNEDRSKEKIKSKNSKLSSTGKFLKMKSMPLRPIFAARDLSGTLYNPGPLPSISAMLDLF